LPKSFPQAELAAAAGATPVRWENVRGSGYGTNTAKWSVELDNGRRVFVKLALDELASSWLRDEWRVYGSLSRGFLPELVAWHDTGGTTFLAIEDLADAYWPPPWLPGHVSLVLETLDDVHAATPPRELPLLADLREALDGWPGVAADPEPFLSTGVCTREWLAAALPRLAQASSECELAGEALVHLDLRSDNLCIRAGRVLVIDWNHACVESRSRRRRVGAQPCSRGRARSVGARAGERRPCCPHRRVLRGSRRATGTRDRACGPRVPTQAGGSGAAVGRARAWIGGLLDGGGTLNKRRRKTYAAWT
jgi:hypothetical protein